MHITVISTRTSYIVDRWVISIPCVTVIIDVGVAVVCVITVVLVVFVVFICVVVVVMLVLMGGTRTDSRSGENVDMCVISLFLSLGVCYYYRCCCCCCCVVYIEVIFTRIRYIASRWVISLFPSHGLVVVLPRHDIRVGL